MGNIPGAKWACSTGGIILRGRRRGHRQRHPLSGHRAEPRDEVNEDRN